MPAQDLAESLPTCAGGTMSLSTPILSGLKKSTRYYSNFELAFNYTKHAVLRYGYYIQQENSNTYVNTSKLYRKKSLNKVKTLEDVYELTQGHPHWVMTSVSSSTLEMGILSGSRLSLSGSQIPNGDRMEFRFDIRTPTTLQRFELWDKFLVEKFDGIMREFSAQQTKPTAEKIVKLALELYYYWVNFAPLTRGTAFTGYSVLYAVILSQGYYVLTSLPKYRQLDWEAILLGSVEIFIQHQSWLKIAPCSSDIELCAESYLDGNSNITNIGELFPTARTVIAALNGGIVQSKEYANISNRQEEETLFEYI